MSLRPLHLLLIPVVAALALAGCAAPEESDAGSDAPASGLCAPVAGESGHPPGTTGSGTGDITTADGGDPSRPPASTQPCAPADGTGSSADGATGGAAGQTGGSQDGTSTGLGEPGGGFSTTEG